MPDKPKTGESPQTKRSTRPRGPYRSGGRQPRGGKPARPDTDDKKTTAANKPARGQFPRASNRPPRQRRRAYHLIVNKMAGKSPEDSVWLAKRLERRLRRANWDAVLHTADNWSDYNKAVVEALRSRPYAVIIFGGDGSVRYAASRVARVKGLLGIVPCGRFNNIFRSLYGHTDGEAALDIIRTEHQTRIDAALANGRFFLGSLVSGLMPVLLQRLGDKNLPRLSMSWSKLAARAADETMPRTTILKVDTYTFNVQPLLLNVHLLSHFMTMRFAPAAAPDDGRAIIIYDRDGTRDEVIRFIRDIRKDRHQFTDGVQMIRGKRISISTGGQDWYMDGDKVEFAGDEIGIEILNRILRIFSNAPEKK